MFLPQFWLRAFASWCSGDEVSRRLYGLEMTIMRSGETYLESIQLDVGVAMGQTLDHGLYNLLGAILVAADTVANLDNGSPVFRGEVLVGRLG